MLACDDGGDRLRACEYECVRLSLTNLLTFPWLRDAVRSGRTALHGAYFDIRSGELEMLDGTGAFRVV